MRRRVFLNKPGEQTVAAVYASLRKDSATLILSDCNRTVSLDLSLYDKEQRDNTLYKVGLLANVISDLYTALRVHCEKADGK